MGKKCGIQLVTDKFSTEVAKLVGDDYKRLTSILAATKEGDKLSKEFKEWHKEIYGKEIELTDKNVASIAKKALKFMNRNILNATTSYDSKHNSNTTIMFGYATKADEILGRHFVANEMLRMYIKAKENNAMPNANKINYIFQITRNAWKNRVIDQIAKITGKAPKDIQAEYQASDNKYNYLKEQLGGETLDVTSKNMLAVYSELFDNNNHSSKYLLKVLTSDSRLQSIRDDVRKDVDKFTEDLIAAKEAEDGKSGDDLSADDDFDQSLKALSTHLGDYTSYLEHISERVRNYFNTLPVCVSSLENGNKPDYNLANRYGMPDTMDYVKCAQMLIGRVDWNTFDSMINSIRLIAKTVPGFASFDLFADKLEQDKDFSAHVRTIFCKTLVTKIQTELEDGIIKCVVPNKRTSTRMALLFDCYNSIRTTAISGSNVANSQEVVDIIIELDSIYKNYNTIIANDELSKDAQDKYNKSKAKIIRLFKEYFPNIDKLSIESYIENRKNPDNSLKNKIVNAKILLDKLKTLTSKSEVVNGKNNELVALSNRAKTITKERALTDKEKEKYQDAVEKVGDLIDPVKSIIAEIVTELTPYSVAELDLNTVNTERNQSSNIINNSYITRIDKLMSSFYTDDKGNRRNDALENWGNYLLQNPQYKYNTLLLSQDGAGGNSIFQYNGDQLVCTPNAENILKIFLYDGALNRDTEVGITYSGMTEGSYLPTVFESFFHDAENDGSSGFANYFLRTPADAPKNFVVRAPKHNTSGLLTIENAEQVEAELEEIVYNHDIISLEQFNSYKAPIIYEYDATTTGNVTGRKRISEDRVVKAITGSQSFLTVPDSVTVDKQNPNVGYISIRVKETKNAPANIIVLKGNIIDIDSKPALNNLEVVGYVANDEGEGAIINPKLKNALKTYYRKLRMVGDLTIGDKTYSQIRSTIDKTHPVFNLFRLQFKQEMLGAAIALDHYFEIEKKGNSAGIIISDDGVKPNDKGNTDKGYANYHFGTESKKLLTEVKDEHDEVIGYKLDGNAFHSSKFTIHVENEDGTFDKVNLLDKLITFDSSIDQDESSINFFYGRADTNNFLHIKFDENGKVIDVEFTEAQQEAIDNAIADWMGQFISQSLDRVNKYNKFISTFETLNQDIIADYMLNYHLAYCAFSDLFDGDPGFYKNTQDILKREKEIQGSGVPYGLVDYLEKDGQPLIPIEQCYLNEDAKLQEFFTSHNIGEKQGNKRVLVARTGFRAVTVKNTITTNTNALQVLRAKLIEKNKDPKYIAQIDMLLKGFEDTKVNDAQSYITFDEWIRRIAIKGQLKQYMPLIERILDESQDVSPEDLEAFVQVQKNFYFDRKYDENYGVVVPRQIKNAEFVLIPRFIRGTELEDVYNAMIEAGIDQLNTVETSKAANEEVLTLWDNEGVMRSDMDKFVEEVNDAKQDYYYRYLYTQQETSQHMNASNKAGIQIMKKMLDNLASSQYKDDIFNNYIANITESFYDLMKEFEVELDENGNIVIDELTGDIKSLNNEAFYKKLAQEMQRLGVDENMMDYTTLEDGQPIMPALLSNVLFKFESIISSVFNNSIVRQKLPGSHAAQITNVGLRAGSKKYMRNKNDRNDVITVEEWNKLSAEEKNNYHDARFSIANDLRYHQDEKGNYSPYVQVKLPLSYLGINRNSRHYKNMTDDEILAELKEKGLDLIIGYRIPTEGKQSVCILQVAGIFDDTCGSTIAVPNDWVSQTGSDFDIDSVYTISYSTYTNKDGEMFKTQYITSSSIIDDNIDALYLSYLRSRSSSFLKSKIKDLFKNVLKNVEQKEDEAFDELCKSLSKEDKQIYINYIKALFKSSAAKYDDAAIRKSFQLAGIIEYAEQDLIDNDSYYTAEQKEAIKTFIKKLDDLDAIIYSKFVDKNNNGDEVARVIYENNPDIETDAIAEGLMSKKEWLDKVQNSPEFANSRDARSNKILQTMIDILSDENSLEENLSRSNFEDISYWLSQCLNPKVRAERENRSVFNILDQIAFQEEAMSGARLKGFSVSLDTWCSVCNVVRPTVSKPITVVYDSKDFTDPAKAAARFGVKITGNPTRISIAHKTYGWSNDNRNIDGRILTAYSSQTTAYILDAIKTGAIPNVNEYTFGAFKTLVNMGLNYKTAISFIIQPGISRIADAFKRNNSVYNSDSYTENPITSAVFDIARELGITVDFNTSIDRVFKEINEKFGKQFNAIFEDSLDKEISFKRNIPLFVHKQMDRNREEGEFSNTTPVEERRIKELLYDLGTIIAFNNIKHTADEIGNIARCCTTDKSAAKQTVFLTNKLFSDIHKEVSKHKDKKSNPILTVNGKHILDSIFPGVMDIDENDFAKSISRLDVSKSSYNSLCAFLKYGSATSVLIARKLLPTVNPKLTSFLFRFKNYLNNSYKDIDEETYNSLLRYFLNYSYTQIPIIVNNISCIPTADGYEYAIDLTTNEEEENQRIYGYNHLAKIDFTVKDKGNPTKEELEAFAKLTPGQKVQWIKTNVSNAGDDAGIFSFIKVQLINLQNRGRKAGMHTLEFTDDSIDKNVIYDLFRQAITNENPLVVMAAMDIVKYAFIVEGYKPSKNGITKIIDNDALINELNEGGMGIVSDINRIFNDNIHRGIVLEGIDLYGDNTERKFFENYLRSHPEAKGIRTIHAYKLESLKQANYSLQDVANTQGLKYISFNKFTKNETDAETLDKWNATMSKLGIYTYDTLTGEYVTNHYVRTINEYGEIKLYRIESVGKNIVLVPLSTLNENEYSKWSTNEKYNIGYKDVEFYDKLMQEYRDAKSKVAINSEWFKDKAREIISVEGNHSYHTRKIDKESTPVNPFDVNDYPIVAEKIAQSLESPTSTKIYISNKEISDFFVNPKGTSIQQVKTDSGYITVCISKPSNLAAIEKRYLGSNQSKEERKATKEQRLQLAETQIEDPIARNVVVNAINREYITIPELLCVTKIEDDSYASTKEEAASLSIKFMTSQRGVSENASQTVSLLHHKGITENQETIKLNETETIRTIASYLDEEHKKLLHEFNNFLEDVDTPGIYYAMNSDEALQAIKNNKALADKFIDIAIRARHLVDTFKIWGEVDTSELSEEHSYYVNAIKGFLDKLSKLPIDDAYTNYANSYISNISTNPLIQDDIINILDGYFKTTGIMWQFHDIAENGNPLLQTILYDVKGDIESKRMASLREIAELEREIKRIIGTAKREGKSVDINKIIKNGRFVRRYNEDFIKDLSDLYSKREEARKVHGLGSIEHLKAKLDYDIFKAKYIHQECKPNYYRRKCTIEHECLTKIPELYSEYTKLRYESIAIYSDISKLGNNPELSRKLNEIEGKMRNLYINPNFMFDEAGNFISRPDDRSKYSIYAASILQSYVSQLKKLNDQYYKYDSVYGFEEQLKINLATVRSYEEPDANGIPTRPITELEKIDKYVEARNWIRENARFDFNYVNDASGRPSSKAAKLREALIKLKQGTSNANRIFEYLSSLKSGKSVKDENGIYDGTQLTSDEIDTLKHIQEEKYGIDGMPLGTDRIIISSTKSPVLYTPEFYRLLSGATSSEMSRANPEYLKLVTELNRELEPYFSGGIIRFDLIPDTDEGVATLNRIADLYQKIRNVQKRLYDGTSEDIEDYDNTFLKNETETVLNEDVWRSQADAARSKSENYRNAWAKVNIERKKDGAFLKDKTGKGVPNRYIYSYIKPKGNPGEASYDRFVDDRNEAINTVNQLMRTVPTRYYYNAMNEALDNGTYKDWYVKNHIYNPYTRTYEPLACWLTKEPRYELFEDDEFEGSWVPRANYRKKSVIDGEIEGIYFADKDKRDNKYKEDAGIYENFSDEYKIAAKYKNPEYDSLNEFELELQKLLFDTLKKNTNTDRENNLLDKGYIPVKSKEKPLTATGTLGEILKYFGLYSDNNIGKKEWYDTIGYEHDVIQRMPLMRQLKSEHTVSVKDFRNEKDKESIENALKETDKTIEVAFRRPVQGAYATEDEYQADLDAYNEVMDKIKEHNKKVHESLMNTNWLDGIKDYLIHAGRYNAIMDNKNKLYYLQDIIKKQQVFSRKYGITGDLKTDDKAGTPEHPVYSTNVDNNLLEQYEVFLRRILFDQWRQPEDFLTHAANMMQNFTSANYMMMNIRGGIANVTLGESSVLAEAAAREHFTGKDYAKAKGRYCTNIHRFIQGLYNEKGTCKEDAIIKAFNVVDYDEITGISKEISIRTWFDRARGWAFSPQSMGEHFMQNTVLFAMLDSHKVVAIENDPHNIGFMFMNENEYVRSKHKDIIYNLKDSEGNYVFTDEEKEDFTNYINSIKQDKNLAKDYAWFRKDVVGKWVERQSKDKRKKYIDAVKSFDAKAKEEFEKMENMYDQIDFIDGYIGFKHDSLLGSLQQLIDDGKMLKSEYLLGKFGERVKSVNNKIHGVYNKMGAAYIESKWYGALVMQYHKHLPMGLLKRYRMRGYYNEARGTVEKGMVASWIDFISTDFNLAKTDLGLTEENVASLEGIQNIMKHGMEIITHLNTAQAWNLISEADRANIRRSIVDILTVLSAVFMSIALLVMMDDDDEKSIAFNLALYEADRLASEAHMYFPIGMFTEYQTLASQPIAMFSVAKDFGNIMSELAGMIFNGDGYDPIFRSGRFAGENRLATYAQRRIPVWSGIKSVIESPIHNKAYKIGRSPLKYLNGESIANSIRVDMFGKPTIKDTKKKNRKKKNTLTKKEI